jgi:Rrf2 family cysteine metabolism transcriptional repressor
MRLSTKARYGVRILLDLALHDSPAPRQLRDIALSQQISEKYISRLIISLRRAELVCSVRGSQGGYRLSCDPKTVTLLDIVEIMEGPITLLDCVLAPQDCARSSACSARLAWDRLSADIRSAMRKVKLQDLMHHKAHK